jgi:hypothetical protein
LAVFTPPTAICPKGNRATSTLIYGQRHLVPFAVDHPIARVLLNLNSTSLGCSSATRDPFTSSSASTL